MERSFFYVTLKSATYRVSWEFTCKTTKILLLYIFLGHNRNVVNTKFPYPIKRLGHIRFSPECHGFDFIKKPTKWQAAQILRQCSRLLPDEYWIERLDKDFRVVETFTKAEFREYCHNKGIL